MGIAQAGIFPASTNSVNYWSPMSERSLGCGLLAVGMQTGAIAASLLTGILLGHIGWRASFTLFAIPSFLWAVFFYVRFRDRPELSPQTNLAERKLIAKNRPIQRETAAEEDTGPTDWGAMLRHRGLWLIYGQQICRAAGYMFFASWFPTFLQQTRGVSIAQSGILQGMIFAGALLGGLFGGILSDWIWRRTGNLWLSRCGVGAFALGGSGLMILGSWFVQQPLLAVAMLATGVMFASLAGPPMFAIVIDISGSRVPQVLGAVNMMGNLAVAACPILIGELFARTQNWDLVLLIFAGIYFTGAVCWALVNPCVGIFKPANPVTVP
ncbi:MAG TPA: MFS transporter, partial [Planctomicrobium sp.]|nr:MFS transporter [Planctomicrobium sp.]